MKNTPELNERMFEAIEKGDLTALREALENGANPNKIGHLRTTPLMAAVTKNSAEAIKILVDYGAEPDLMPTNSSRYPVVKAAVEENKNLAFDALLEAGADRDITVADKGPDTSLFEFAAKCDNEHAFLQIAKSENLSTDLSCKLDDAIEAALRLNSTKILKTYLREKEIFEPIHDEEEYAECSKFILGRYPEIRAELEKEKLAETKSRESTDTEFGL